MSYTVQPHTSRHPGLKHDMTQVKATSRVHSTALTGLRKDLTECKLKIQDQAKKVLEQDKKILDQNRMIAEQSRKISEQTTAISDLTSKFLTQEQKVNGFFAKHCTSEGMPFTDNDDKKSTAGTGTKTYATFKEERKIVDVGQNKANVKSSSRKRKHLDETEHTSDLPAQHAEVTSKYPRRNTRSKK